MSDEKYINSSQQRILQVLLAMFGHEIQGLAPSDLAKGLGISPSEATRSLANLRLAGVAEQLPDTGRWRLTPRIPQKAVAMLQTIERAAARVDEVRNRYTRT